MGAKKKILAVKVGLVDDPKHRRQMGECIWLYLYVVRLADYPTGTVKEWNDAAASEHLDIPLRTIRHQRNKLEQTGYITCRQTQHGQVVTVTKWLDPLKGWGENGEKQGGNGLQPSASSQGGNVRPPSLAQGGNSLPLSKVHGGNQGGNPTSPGWQSNVNPPTPPHVEYPVFQEDSGGEYAPRARMRDPGWINEPAIDVYFDVFLPEKVLSLGTQERIIAEATDLGRWALVCRSWRDDNYRPESVDKMLSRYTERNNGNGKSVSKYLGPIEELYAERAREDAEDRRRDSQIPPIRRLPAPET